MKCTKEALEKAAKDVIGMTVTDVDGKPIGKVISAEVVQGDIQAKAEKTTIIPSERYIKFTLGLEAEE